ncbi:ABC transporter permease [Laedolimicola ammoniilytica]|uniref:ABC transporter permease n=1 Tax=Laedolimicola ammoniilytica TaxID=2981771 RepID=A0ABT2S0V7_9FIRM|nr:ABC transporter permease [Laedolimicola ammoniilytica]MCU6698181.1 ABC transporter permease [Laedolimicola ammoniilytica]SCI67091.1 FtsX-like permease family [uncultured Clostridium sp.]
MKNPLRKRLLRELKSEIGKYLVIFLLLAGTISLVSGFLVADGSMIIAYNEGFEKYNIEDGNFRLGEKANKAQLKTIQELGVTVYDLFYAEEALTNGSTLRIYPNRDQVDLVCLMDGAMPTGTDEIAIDRMYADNNGLTIGDRLESGARSWIITGLVALPDYSCLFSDNNDSMFDAVKFGVAIVTPEMFANFSKDELYWNYAWKYDVPPEEGEPEQDAAEDLMQGILNEADLENFVPAYQNQAIQFTGDDMGSDQAMMVILLYIVILIMAFVFGITTSNTISREANVIGTLRASGYTKNELIRHYMTMPTIVTLVSALIGNILGYTSLKEVCAGMYYGSYSLPTYVTIWNAEAFVETTVVPVLLMMVVNYLVLRRKLGLSPLKFLRRDLSRRKQKHAMPLSQHIPFFTRFRLRIIFQNVGNYLILFIGILFANMLLMFGLALPAVLDHYQAEIEQNLLCNYQYILQVPYDAMNEDKKLESMISMLYFQSEVETDNEDAEKFTAYALNTPDEPYMKESVTLYGLQDDSRYIPIDFRDDGVYISSAYAEKYLLEPGDTITLYEEYGTDAYTFRVDDVYHYEGGLTVFMPQKQVNDLFDLGNDYFSGYLSDTEITDIDGKYIGTMIDAEALTKISRQLTVSMGSMMGLVNGFAMLMFMVLVYLLSKIIIEKNAQSISMTKILGYSNREISGLYIMSTTIVVILFLLNSLPIEYEVMVVLFRAMMLQSISGWITFYIGPEIYVEMFVMGFGTYLAVALLEYRKIRHVPMDAALKNVE